MRVCHITVAHPRYDARIFLREASTLAEAGNKVFLICADGKGEEVKNEVLITSYSSRQMSKRDRFKLLFFNTRFVDYLLSFNADVYQFHDLELVEVGRKLKRKNRKVIFDSHENWIDLIPGYFPKNKFIQKYIANVFIPRYYRKVVSIFDAVFSVSPNMVEKLKRFNPRTFFIPNYPSIANYKKLDVDKKNFILYQGMVYKISNQKEIIKAVNNLPFKFKYKIVGKIDKMLKDELEAIDINQKVEFVNWIDKSELDILMRQALVGLVVLDYCPICCGKDGQLGSNKIFEYMLSGLPVICTDFKLWKELIIDKYNCGICVNPRDIKQIQEAIEWFFNHEAEAKEMGLKGRNAVLKEFNWEAYKNTFLDVYDKISGTYVNT